MTFTHFHRILFIIGTTINLILKRRKWGSGKSGDLSKVTKLGSWEPGLNLVPETGWLSANALPWDTSCPHIHPSPFGCCLQSPKYVMVSSKLFQLCDRKRFAEVIWSSALRPPSFPSWCVWQSPQQMHMDLLLDTNLPSSLLHTKSSRPLAKSNAWS